MIHRKIKISKLVMESRWSQEGKRIFKHWVLQKLFFKCKKVWKIIYQKEVKLVVRFEPMPRTVKNFSRFFYEILYFTRESF